MQGPAIEKPEVAEDLADKSAQRDKDNPSIYCPVCSARLEPCKCKLLCRTCGYYMSCSDYY